MFIISNGNMEGPRRNTPPSNQRNSAFNHNAGSGTTSSSRNAGTPADATQRVHIDTNSPPRRPAPSAPRWSSGAAPNRSATGNGTGKKPSRASKNQKITIITLSAIAAVLLIAILITGAIVFAEPEDDGLILNNVIAAGVNLGGKTPDAAKLALKEATQDTYTKLDMSVEVLDTKILLTPTQTGAILDVDAVVEAAYNYGRTGSRAERQKAKNQSLTSHYVIDILPYLNLDTDYIQDVVDQLGETYSSTLSKPSYRVEGTLPDLEPDTQTVDLEKVYQKLIITLGTPEYSLNTGKLYDQILDAYNTHIFNVKGDIQVNAPDVFDLDAVYQELCKEPVDAVLDEFTYEVTPEKYGYGFDLAQVRLMLENADYGDVIEVSMGYIRPNLTEEELTDGLFETLLAYHSTPTPIEKEILINLKLACRAINGQMGGLILKAGESFSFNDTIGTLTEDKGFKKAQIYVGKAVQEVVGGGISQVASMLYYCALQADMDILERSNHSYAPAFIETGLDAEVNNAGSDLRFKNTTGRPVRIIAEVTDSGTLEIQIWGTANKDYKVDIVYETVKTYKSETLTSTMIPDNPEGYVSGDVLVQPITGYDVCTYKVYRYTDAAIAPVKKLIAFSHYDKLDKVVVEIETPSPVLPSDPTDPVDPTEDPNAPTTEPNETE